MKKLVGVTLFLVCTSVLAQHHQPYAGQNTREIKALSDEEIQQYLNGAGMGFAKAAELNHVPGPMHALELADQLLLTTQQREAIRQLMEAHKKEARAIGAKFIESERSLDALFHQPDVDPQMLARAVQEATRLGGEYRLSHLETHRRMRAILTAEQIAMYDNLRGYDQDSRQHGS